MVPVSDPAEGVANGTAAEAAAADREAIDVDDGRYLYCLVDTADAEHEPTLSATGVDDEPVHVVEEGSVGAVVHDCEGIYDTDDPETMRDWVLAHQRVVDAADETFGTPLPIRFDTVLEGGDEGVRKWLSDRHDEVRAALGRFAGTKEYRIHLVWDDSGFLERVDEADDRLGELDADIQAADEGEAFLLEKERENRLRELKESHREELATALTEAVDPHVEDRIEQDEVPSSLQPETDRGDVVARLAVLAREANEDELGDALDEVVEREGVEIKFTGPWPPYTFAPDIG